MQPSCSALLALLCVTIAPAVLCPGAEADERVSAEAIAPAPASPTSVKPTIADLTIASPLAAEPLAQAPASEATPPEPSAEPPAALQPAAGIPADAVPPGGFLLNPALLDGERISEIQIYLENPPADSDRSQQIQQQIAQAFTLRAGDSYSQLFLNAGLQRVEQLAFVETAQAALYEVQIPGEVVVVLAVRLTDEAVSSPSETGILVTGNWQEFPNLYTSDRATAVAILRGSFSNFSSNNSWFGNAPLFTQGNPLAPDPARAGTYSWLDGYLELGFAGITQIDTLPLYVYGSITDIVSTTLQPDLFQSNDRIFNGIEDLYGGFVYGYRTDNSRFGINLSAGRQDYRISNGMLLANGAGNGGDRAAVLSNPRTAFENTVIGRIRWNDIRLEGFYLDPNELPLIDSQTKFIGANLEYDNNRSVQLGLSYLYVPNSNSSYFTLTDTFSRAGLNVIYPRVRLSNLFGLEGLWLQGEYAYQWNDNFAMAANAAWGQLGYTLRELPWTPTLSYRYAYFSGDDPNTVAFERFDPLLSGGNPDTWIQGTNLVKLYQNSNLITHQAVLRLSPSQRFDLSLQYIHLSAAGLNNLGGTQALSFLESSEIGQEVTLTGRYNLSRNFLLYASGSVAFPGAAIQRVVGDNPGPWYFLQLSVLMNF